MPNHTFHIEYESGLIEKVVGPEGLTIVPVETGLIRVTRADNTGDIHIAASGELTITGAPSVIGIVAAGETVTFTSANLAGGPASLTTWRVLIGGVLSYEGPSGSFMFDVEHEGYAFELRQIETNADGSLFADAAPVVIAMSPDTLAPVIEQLTIGVPTGSNYPIVLKVTETDIPITVHGVVTQTSGGVPSLEQIKLGLGAGDQAAAFSFTYDRSVDGDEIVDFGALPDGDFTLSIVISDSAGNTSMAAPVSFSLAAPVITGVPLIVGEATETANLTIVPAAVSGSPAPVTSVEIYADTDLVAVLDVDDLEYQITRDDVGKNISVIQKAVNEQGETSALTTMLGDVAALGTIDPLTLSPVLFVNALDASNYVKNSANASAQPNGVTQINDLGGNGLHLTPKAPDAALATIVDVGGADSYQFNDGGMGLIDPSPFMTGSFTICCVFDRSTVGATETLYELGSVGGNGTRAILRDSNALQFKMSATGVDGALNFILQDDTIGPKSLIATYDGVEFIGRCGGEQISAALNTEFVPQPDFALGSTQSGFLRSQSRIAEFLLIPRVLTAVEIADMKVRHTSIWGAVA